MTNEEKAQIIYFKTGINTANQTLAKFGYPRCQDSAADTLLVPYGARDGYSYITLDGKTRVDIRTLFPSRLLQMITSYMEEQ